jgi:putative sigma-54 modulation protein
VQIKISTRHGSISDATREKIGEKVERLNRLFERLTSIEVTIDMERRELPVVDLKVSAEHKHDFAATAQVEDIMASIDQVVHKLEQQLRKYKEKVVDRHRGSPARESGSPVEESSEVASDSEPAS